jgi:dolichol-phosphate mannosyltransferase
MGIIEGLSLILPAYNEADALPLLIYEINQTLHDLDFLEVIIVNDGSQDTTSDVMQTLVVDHQQGKLEHINHLQVFDLPSNQGMGAALKYGFDRATLPWVSFLPADGQIAPQELLIAAKIIQTDTILVSTAYHNRTYTWKRKILSHGLRLLNRCIVGVHVVSEGMYLIRRDVLQSFPLHSNSFMLNLEIPIRCHRLQYKCQLAHIAVRARQGGVSSATQWGRIYNTLQDLIKLRYVLEKESRFN